MLNRMLTERHRTNAALLEYDTVYMRGSRLLGVAVTDRAVPTGGALRGNPEMVCAGDQQSVVKRASYYSRPFSSDGEIWWLDV